MTQNSVFLSGSSATIGLGANSGGPNFVGSSAAGGALTQWQGGRSALLLNATIYASGAVYFQMLCSDGSTLLNLGGPYGSNQIVSFDLPKGQYKIVNGQSSSIGVYAVLASVPYA
jgi:hypothetical protein